MYYIIICHDTFQWDMPKTREEKCTVFAKTVMPHGKHYRVGCYESVWLL